MTKIFSKEERTRHIVSTSASLVALAVVVLPIAWYIVQPLLVSSVSAAMASDIESTMDRKIAPITGGLKAIIQTNINRLRRTISTHEYRRDSSPTTWTQADASELTNLEIDLDGQVIALRAMQ